MQTEHKLRVFSPVILFHDHQVSQDDSSSGQIHLPCGDPFHHDNQIIELHKRRVSRMLEHNGRCWSDIITWSRDHALATDHSPVPSLVSSPTPPLESRELPSPRQSPPPPSSHRHHNKYTHPRHQHRRTHSKHKVTAKSSTSAPITNASVPAGSTSIISTTTKSDAKTNKRRRGNLPKAVTAILREWLSDHKKHPYPTEDEKDALASKTGLSLNQISNWFINARRRILQPMLEQQEEERQTGPDVLSYDNSNHSSDDSTDRRLRKRPATEALQRQDTLPQKRIHSRRRS